jgi:hypothetical protein
MRENPRNRKHKVKMFLKRKYKGGKVVDTKSVAYLDDIGAISKYNISFYRNIRGERTAECRGERN